MRDVSRESPCPICGKPDWCVISEDGEMVVCNRTESDRPARMGYIHFLSDPAPPPGEPKPPIPKLAPEECERIARECFKHPDAGPAREALAGQLGVTVDSLERLRVGVGHDWDQRTWTSWPCRDAAGTVIGLTRRYSDGSKKTYPGTRAGLFYSVDWSQTPGVVLIVEGGSDVAACISCGMAAIGRPSNTGGVGYIADLLKKHPRRAVIVVAERDFKPERRGTVDHCPPDCAGCANCWPGLYGAKATAERLGMPLNWILPRGGKDIREAIGNESDVGWVRNIWSAS